MRNGLSTPQQTLSPEVAAVLRRSAAEAGRRRHSQTTPLHVAEALLPSSPLLRRALAAAAAAPSTAPHPRPLHCRALELCFSIALDRLPSSNHDPNPSPAEPPMSNALAAVLKRAQAHHRRGGPAPAAPAADHHHRAPPPLLAARVELEQLLLSVLDDPSVSRVMREASLSSAAVKSAVEQTLASSSPSSPPPSPSSNPYLSPRFRESQSASASVGGGGGEAGDSQRRELDARRVFDVMLRPRRRNPVIVADSDYPEAVTKEILQKIKAGGGAAHVIAFNSVNEVGDRSRTSLCIRELGASIESRIDGGGAVVLDLGDLKWLVLCTWPDFAREVVAEIGKLVSRFSGGGGGGGRFWLVGAATCDTYLRLRINFPTVEDDWDLQAVPIATRAPLPRFRTMAVPLSRPPAAADASTRIAAMCQLCTANYELELAKLVEEDRKKRLSEKAEAQQGLPQWLQLAMLGNDRIPADEKALVRKQRIEESQVKWMEKCFLLHPNFHSALLDSSEKPLYPSLATAPSFFAPCPQFKPNSTVDKSIRPLEISKTRERSSNRPKSPPGSPMKTELALGPSKPCDFSEKPHTELLKDFSDQPESKIRAISDTDIFKKLLKGLLEEVTWQPNAASTIAAVVTQCKCGGGRRRPLGPEGDTWLLFLGPDKVGKRKMATALSELMFGSRPSTICLSGSSLEEEEDINVESTTNFWGKTFVDRVVDAVRRKPFSVIMIEDFDRADSQFQLSIKRAMEKGRLTDSHGREIGLGSAIIILASNWLPPEEFNGSQDSLIRREEKILNSATSNWQLEFSLVGNPAKRRADWLRDGDRALKLRKGSSELPFDLNLAAEAEDEADEGSRNSSDVTVEHEFEKGRLATKCSTKSLASDLMELADAAIVFNPIDLGPLKRKVIDCISEKFKAKMGDRYTLTVDDDTVDRIVANICLKKATLEEWTRRVLCPSIENLKDKLDDAQGHKAVVRLSTVRVRVRDPTAQETGGGQDRIPIAVDIL